MARLDNQKAPSKLHKRTASKFMVRGYNSFPHSMWGDTLAVRAAPGLVTVGEPTITASDGTNAGRLAGLGYTAYPTTNWTTGQSVSVNGFLFNWNGSAWAAGAHA